MGRRSTPGVHLQFLGASIHFCSKTQSVVALSSAESELYGIGLGVAESLHARSFLLEANLASSVNIELYTDSSAAKSIANAFGTSKRIRHIDLKYLYVQDLVHVGVVKLLKIQVI